MLLFFPLPSHWFVLKCFQIFSYYLESFFQSTNLHQRYLGVDKSGDFGKQSFHRHNLPRWQVASVVSDSVRPHRRQPTRLLRPWDSLGKNTGVGCHFLLQCMEVKSEIEVAQSCLTLSDPMECSPPGSSVHGISPARVLECIAFSGVVL